MKILLFARARDLAGADTIEIALPASATAADVRRVLAAAYPKLAPLLNRSALAVDDEFSEDDTPVPPGSVVALLPPLSGG